MEPFKTANEPTVEPTANREEAGPPQAITGALDPVRANPTLEQYTADNGQPYANEYFETGTPFEYLPSDIQNSLSDIDKYVEMELADQGKTLDLRNYNKVISELKAELMLGEEPGLNEVIDRLAGYARNMIKIQGVDDIRQTLRQKLKRLRRSKDMDNEVLKAIGRKII